ncbi:hypothetical protein [Brachybacterium sacelli]|uniref:hypothetical protein n=1 Tax=Brachybacterium sacelli TaxID=173364 RepID=UPI003607A476
MASRSRCGFSSWPATSAAASCSSSTVGNEPSSGVRAVSLRPSSATGADHGEEHDPEGRHQLVPGGVDQRLRDQGVVPPKAETATLKARPIAAKRTAVGNIAGRVEANIARYSAARGRR